MKTQQDMIRAACIAVIGRVPTKGEDAKTAFTPEVREKIAEVMIPLLGVEWEIKSDFTKGRARDYIVGVSSTDLLESWTFTRNKKDKKEINSPVGNDKMSLIKAALDAGLITQEIASDMVAKLLVA
jgi:hypothetical protein